MDISFVAHIYIFSCIYIEREEGERKVCIYIIKIKIYIYKYIYLHICGYISLRVQWEEKRKKWKEKKCKNSVWYFAARV